MKMFRTRFGMRAVVAFVGLCALLFWAMRFSRDNRPAYLYAGWLTDGDDSRRLHAALELGGLKTEATIAVPALTRALLTDRIAPVRKQSAVSLAGVVSKLNDASFHVREMGIFASWATAETSPKLSIALLNDNDLHTRRSVVEALARSSPLAASVVPELTAALTDEDAAVRAGAALSLGNIRPAPPPAVTSSDESKPAMRPISDAESVLAVYREDWGRGLSGEPALIFAAWPEGSIVWSADRLKGGAPYRAGHVDPKRFVALLARFDKDGLFADERLSRAYFGPDSQFTTVLVKSGKKQVKMQSWHELLEESDKLVADHNGAGFLDGRRRLDVLRKAPADYLFYRFVWSETRTKLADLIPGQSTASGGKPFRKAGKLSWQEPAATRTPDGAGTRSGK